MFETHAQARLQNPFFVLEEGAQRSAYISLTSSDEWFFVTYETVDEKISSQQQFMVSTVRPSWLYRLEMDPSNLSTRYNW
ncbi:hypothetical protein IMW75_24720 [Pseudomonas gregormendelii]|uniref:Uncharacterized protein n=1 Tax=Pseudomonas gregormendelii TaxID=1628277 RepID=A0ABS3ANH4_9PSED|nr:hypothetical protein [Pseudomonas gregormendelii]MBN3968462.1 hypothetical protein [Pseudomonas gregormendelii]